MNALNYLPGLAGFGWLWLSLAAHPYLFAAVVVLALFIRFGAPLVGEFRKWDAMRLRERRLRRRP